MNPYGYNSISLKRMNKVRVTPTAAAMIVSPLYNRVSKALGVDTVRDWDKYYDKVYRIVEWAKNKSGIQDETKLTKWIYDQVNHIPSVNGRAIDDLYIYSKMSGDQPKPKKPSPIKELKKGEDPVKVEEHKPEEDVGQFVNKWIKETLESQITATV